jgi:hypothetical protein
MFNWRAQRVVGRRSKPGGDTDVERVALGGVDLSYIKVV